MQALLTLSANQTPLPRTIISVLKGYEMVKDDITLQLGQRWAEALRQKFGSKNTAKKIAHVFDVEVRTARSWLEGAAPFIKYIYVAGQKLGSGFVADILTPDNKWKTFCNIDEALDEMEKQICQLRNEIKSLQERGRE